MGPGIDPETLRKARFWHRASRIFNLIIGVIVIVLIVGVLVETLSISRSIQSEIMQNAVSRDNQLKSIQNTLATLHEQADNNRKAYNSYQTCVSQDQLNMQRDFSNCNHLLPK